MVLSCVYLTRCERWSLKLPGGFVLLVPIGCGNRGWWLVVLVLKFVTTPLDSIEPKPMGCGR
eukprot:6491323-Amphidinium_carterae.2